MDQEELLLKPKPRSKAIITILVVIFFVVLASVFSYYKYKSYCSSTVKFSLGEVDPKFNLTENEIVSIVNDAAARWDKTSGTDVFEYDPTASLKINLVYDERQANVDKLKATVSDLNQKNQSLDAWKDQLKVMISSYDADLAAYNAEVNSWNAKGGAPTDVFNQLESKRKALDARRVDINKTAELMNIQVGKYNLSVDQIKTEADKGKNQLITEGMYFSKENKIDIYTFSNTEELRLVLMHELGHARGAEHATNDSSIMYAILGEQNLADPLPTEEDVSMINSSCKIRIMNNFFSRSSL